MKKGTDPTSAAYTVFFLKNAQHNTQPLEVYLERRGFKVQTETSVEKAIDKINEKKPIYVFVAWDHTDKEAQNIISLTAQDTTIIPYITSTAGSDTRKLMSLNVPVKMFPPLSGPAIQRLVLKLEKEKNDLKGLQSQTISSNKTADNSSQVYISKGQRFSDKSKIIVNRSSSENNSTLSFFDSVTDLSLEKPTAQFSKDMHIKISEGQKKALEARFEGKIQEELKEIIETTKDSSPAEPQQTIFCMLVQAIDCSGLILLDTAWNMSLEDAESALSSWANELTFQYHKNDGIKNIYQSEVFSVTTPSELNVFDICAAKAAVQKNIEIDGKNTVMAFFDLQYNPFSLETTEDENYLLVDQNCLNENSVIPFDLFYEMKENKKMLKMFKKDTLMSNKEINSVLEKKILPLLISMSDEMLWYKYGVEVYLKKL